MMLKLTSPKIKVVAILLSLTLLQVSLSGCAEIGQGAEYFKGRAEYFWEKIKGEQTEKQIETREEAIQRYKYEGNKEKLFIENPNITPKIAYPGKKIKQEIQYSFLLPQREKQVKVMEAVFISNGEDNIDLTKKEKEKAQGTYISYVFFTIPEDLNEGEYKLVTTISLGSQRKTVTGNFWVKK